MTMIETQLQADERRLRFRRYLAELEDEGLLERLIVGRRDWSVAWYGALAEDDGLSAEAKLAGIALNTWQCEAGPPYNGPFPRFEELAEKTGGFRERDIAWALPELIRKGYLQVVLPEPPSEEREQARRPRRKASIPATLRWAVWARDDFTCRKCGAREYLTVDHVFPESKGGPTTLDNLQTLCGRCNNVKGVRMPDDGLRRDA